MIPAQLRSYTAGYHISVSTTNTPVHWSKCGITQGVIRVEIPRPPVSGRSSPHRFWCKVTLFMLFFSYESFLQLPFPLKTSQYLFIRLLWMPLQVRFTDSSEISLMSGSFSGFLILSPLLGWNSVARGSRSVPVLCVGTHKSNSASLELSVLSW